MADKIKVKLPEDVDLQPGMTLEFEVGTESVILPDSLLHVKQVRQDYVPKQNVEKDIQTRLRQQAVNLKSELLQDDDFSREILIAKGVPLNEEGEIEWPESDKGLSPEEFAQKVKDQVSLQRLQWEQRELKPLTEKAGQYESEIDKLRKQILYSEILEAARQAGVKKEKFETLPGAPLSTAPVIQQTAYRFGFDPETGQWAVKTGEGYMISTHDDPDRPYAGPTELFNLLKEDQAVKDRWFEDQRPGGPSPGRPNEQKGKSPDEKTDTERQSELLKMDSGFATR